MIIVGAKGFAKEVLEVLHQLGQTEHLAFFDDVSTDLPQQFMGQFPLLRSYEEVKEHFGKYGPEFTLGLGQPERRAKLNDKISELGGKLTSVISPTAEIGSFNVRIGEGCNVLPLGVIANDTTIGQGCIIYYNALVTHDCKVGNFVELSPGATLLGGCEIGNFTHIGANATVLPGIRIGEHAVIAAGAVVTHDVPNNSMMAGVPASIKKQL